MPSNRLSIKKLTLIKRTTQHAHIVPTPNNTGQGDTRYSAGS